MSIFTGGLLFALGVCVGFLILATLMGLVGRLEYLKKRKQENEARKKPATATDTEIRKNIIQAAFDLDLWTRTGRLKGMRIDAMLVNDQSQAEIYPGGRTRFQVKVKNSDGRELARFPFPIWGGETE